MLMPCAIIPMDHIIALVKLDTLGMAISVQVKPFFNGFKLCRLVVAFRIQLFHQRLSHESVKAYATMPIVIMGSKSFSLFDLKCL